MFEYSSAEPCDVMYYCKYTMIHHTYIYNDTPQYQLLYMLCI